MKKIFIIIFSIFMIYLSACTKNNVSIQEFSEKEKEMILMNQTLIKQDLQVADSAAEEIANLLTSLNVQEIQTFQIEESSKDERLVKLIDSRGVDYYLTLNKVGEVKTIQRGDFGFNTIIYNETISENQKLIVKKMPYTHLQAWGMAECFHLIIGTKMKKITMVNQLKKGDEEEIIYEIKVRDEKAQDYYIFTNVDGGIIRVTKESKDGEVIFII